jgi:hypothetical protein
MSPSICLGWALILGCYTAILIGIQNYPVAGIYAVLSGVVIAIGAARAVRDRELEHLEYTVPTARIHRER